MDAIKKFFDKKNKDIKFKKAGPGRSLAASSRDGNSSGTNRQERQQSYERHEPSRGAQRAGEAALSRLASNKAVTPVDWSMHAIKAQARREMEQEMKMRELSLKDQEKFQEAEQKNEETIVTQHVMFSCPLLGSQIGQYNEIKESIRTMLYSQLGEDKGVAACLIIQTCNKGLDKIKVCVETLCKYVENIELNPDEEKYRRIRQTNKAYQERVKPIEGSKEFLEAAGFVEQELPFNDTTDKFWVFPQDGDVERLKELRDALVCAEPVRPTLERSAALLLPRQASAQPDLPPEFFALSKEELKREMQQRSEALEQSMVLRTKAMRERQNMREMRKYRYSLIRVRFPDGLTLQGTFRIMEKLSDVMAFIRMYLANDWRPFCLSISGGSSFTEEDESKTLAELYLVPAVLLNFKWDSEVSDPSLDDAELWGPAAYELLAEKQQEQDELQMAAQAAT